MIVFKLLRGLKTIFSSKVRKLHLTCLRLKWLSTGFCKAKIKTKSRIAHILVTKKIEYADLARVCVESFLSHNPEFEVIIHTDKESLQRLQNKFRITKHLTRLRVVCDQSESESWQEQKLNLILELSGSSDVFMDADLRWNGQLPKIDTITFFVREFEMKEKSPFREILRTPEFNKYPDTFMKNLSFFSFSGTKSPIASSATKALWNSYKDLCRSGIVGADDIEKIERVSEQFIMSLVMCNNKTTVSYLKSSDSIKDGDFVESCYYGATGGIFW